MPRKMPTSVKSGRGAAALSTQEAEDQPADDGTDEQPAEPDEVAAP